MKKIFVLILILFVTQACAISAEVFSEKNRFGLKDDNGNVIIEPSYQKMIKLGDSSYIIRKRLKYGIISNTGEILVEPKYTHVDRFFDRYVKLGNTHRYGVFNDKGEALLKPEYTSIELLSDTMLLTLKDFKYGITDLEGAVILKNVFDDIYMPDDKTLRLQYKGKWFEIQQLSRTSLELPTDLKTLQDNPEYQLKKYDIGTTVGYSALTFTDYLIKMFSSVSPSHEETIDELLLSHGADTVSILLKMSWIPKYPFTFIRKYYTNLRTPNNGTLSNYKDKLRSTP